MNDRDQQKPTLTPITTAKLCSDYVRMWMLECEWDRHGKSSLQSIRPCWAKGDPWENESEGL